MRIAISKLIRIFSQLSVVFGAISTTLWLYVVISSDGFLGMDFAIFVAAGFCIFLLFGVIPGTILYIYTREQRDLQSLVTFGKIFLLILFEFLMLGFSSLHGC